MEDGAPLLEGQVRGDDDRALLVAAADDVEEQIGGASVAGDVAEFVENQQVRCDVSLETTRGRWEGLLSEQVGECGVERGESDGVALLEGAQAEVLGERALADAGRSAQQDVLGVLDEVEAEQVLVALAIDLLGVGPLKLVEWLEGSERGGLRPAQEIASVAFA